MYSTGRKSRHRWRKLCRRTGKWIALFCIGFMMIIVICGWRNRQGIGTIGMYLWKQISENDQPEPLPDKLTLVEWKSIDWNLTLVNRQNPIPEDYWVSLTTLNNGLLIDKRCYPDLQDMIRDCEQAGLSPIICSAYRTEEFQRKLFQNGIKSRIAKGYPESDAVEETAKWIARPGTSEHQLGLAVDIVDAGNQQLDETQEDTAVQKWLMEHSYEYGFILRYPNEKSEITGILYEPWHYRYVGKEPAKEIYEQNLCLEEYLENFFFVEHFLKDGKEGTS